MKVLNCVTLLYIMMKKNKAMFTKIYDIFFHRHKWVIKGEFPLHDWASKHVGQGYILQCEKCGNVKYKKLKF